MIVIPVPEQCSEDITNATSGGIDMRVRQIWDHLACGGSHDGGMFRCCEEFESLAFLFYF